MFPDWCPRYVFPSSNSVMFHAYIPCPPGRLCSDLARSVPDARHGETAQGLLVQNDGKCGGLVLQVGVMLALDFIFGGITVCVGLLLNAMTGWIMLNHGNGGQAQLQQHYFFLHDKTSEIMKTNMKPVESGAPTFPRNCEQT